MMPVVSGLDILQQLRADEAFVDLPVVILTAATDRATKLEALRLGATEFLNKPADSAELEARIRNVLKVKAHQDWLKHYAWELELEVAIRTTELVHAHLEVIECLAKVGEYRDTDTGNHVLRVGCYAGIIARHLGLPLELAERIRLAAPLHDIGKVGIPDAILHKPGKLEHWEMEVMQQHSPFGRKLCENSPEDRASAFIAHSLAGVEIVAKSSSPVLQMAASIAHTHHEKWDGTGYPQGLAGEAIPIEGRITAVADVFDALCSRRPYKPAFPLEKALEIIRQGRGTHFDPAVVDAFFRGLEEILAAQRQFADEMTPPAPQGNSDGAALAHDC
jgi:putative two-component system response regulator